MLWPSLLFEEYGLTYYGLSMATTSVYDRNHFNS